MQGRVDDREVAGMADRLAQHGRDVRGIEFIAEPSTTDPPASACLERHLGYLAIRGGLDARDDAVIIGRNDLPARSPNST